MIFGKNSKRAQNFICSFQPHSVHDLFFQLALHLVVILIIYFKNNYNYFLKSKIKRKNQFFPRKSQ